jgi:hypothetical protein
VEKRQQTRPLASLQLGDLYLDGGAEEDFAEGHWGGESEAARASGAGMVLRGVGGGVRNGVGL